MSERTFDASEIRSRVDSLDAELFDGRTSGYVRTGETLNLNALAIGLGLEHVTYEPEQFAGLVYQPESVTVTVVLFADGTIVPIDAPDAQTGKEAIETTVDRAEELGLLDANVGTEHIRIPATDVPLSIESL